MSDLTTGRRILIAEDDAELRALLVRGLKSAEFEVRAAATGAELLSRFEAWEPDALIVDIGLPDSDGRDVCQALRAHGAEVPIVFLTAHDSRTDRLAGFRAGGDDYVVKPFDFDELVARLSALLRRAGRTEDGPAGGLHLDPVAHAARCEGQAVALTPTEFRLLAALLARPGQTVRRPTLRAAAWPDGAIVHDNTLDVYVARIRRKLASLPGAPSIKTLYAVGFTVE